MLLLSYRVIYIPTPHPTPPPVHLPPILSPTQLDTPLSSHSHLLSISSLYHHPLSWTPSLPTFPYHLTFLLSYSYCPHPPYTITHSAGHPPCLPPLTILLSYFPTLTVHLLPILSLTQLDTLPSQCELRLLRLQQRQRRVLERGRWLFPRPPNQVPIR